MNFLLQVTQHPGSIPRVTRRRRSNIQPVVLSQQHRDVGDDERCMILEVADELVYEAGRTTLALALRGSRNQKLARYKVQDLPGFGMYRGMPEDEVLARVDQLVRDGILDIQASLDGFPLLAYTPHGLKLSENLVAQRWLRQMREHLPDEKPFHPPFAYDLMPNRNTRTLNLVIDVVLTDADEAWLPMLRSWSSGEVKKVRAKLAPLIERLEHGK